MSFSKGFQKTAIVGTLARGLGTGMMGLGRMAVKASGGAVPALLNLGQVASDASGYKQKFNAASRRMNV